MRYIIETDNHEAVQNFIDSTEGVEPITKYEPIERLTAKVEKMRQAFLDFKSNRGNWKIMNYYLRGRGIAQNEIDRVLDGVEEFMKLVESK